MNQTADQNKRRAVLCLFCGLHTPAPETRSANDPRICIIRCRRCGKEAPYPANKIVDGQNMADSQTLRVRVVGLN